jgi:centrosomal protein CEP112
MAMTHEQQKFELQKRQTVAIQELMDETNVKLSKMQTDYDQLTESTVSTQLL